MLIKKQSNRTSLLVQCSLLFTGLVCNHNWLLEPEPYVLLVMLSGLDWSECVLDDALLVSPVRSDCGKTDGCVVSGEHITPLPVHHPPETAKSLCFVSLTCQLPAVQMNLGYDF